MRGAVAHLAGGADVTFLVLAAALLVLGVALVRGGDRRLLGIALIAGAIGLAGGAVTFGDAGPTDARVAIVTPTEGERVEAGDVPLAVDLSGGTLVGEGGGDAGGAATQGHLHVSVDGRLQSMPSAERQIVPLEPGAHRLTVEFVDVRHRPFSPRILDEVEVTAA